jgi:hypothetical protein
MLGLAWSVPGRRCRSHRPATVVSWSANEGEKEEGESEREWVGRAAWFARPGGVERAARESERERGVRARAGHEHERAGLGHRGVLGRAREERREAARVTGFCFFFQKCK